MKIIPYEVKTGEENMQIDSDLLDYAIANQIQEPIFRLYGWSPACVSLGRNQDDKFLNKEFLKQKGIDTVRRLTGGRALLHDNEITYSFICSEKYLKNGEHIISSYKEICQIFTYKFKNIGIEIDYGKKKQVKTGYDYCMLVSTGADLCYRGKKLIGSAQCRKHGYILQHGSILYDYNKNLLEEIFGENINTDEITCIREIDSNIKKSDIIKLLTKP